MRLHRRYFTAKKSELQDDKTKGLDKAEVGHVINQAMIWIAIVLLAIATAKMIC